MNKDTALSILALFLVGQQNRLGNKTTCCIDLLGGGGGG